MILYDIIWYYMILYDYHMYDMYVKCVCILYIYQLMPCVYLSSHLCCWGHRRFLLWGLLTNIPKKFRL